MNVKVQSPSDTGTDRLPKGVDFKLRPRDTEEVGIPIPQFQLEDVRPEPEFAYKRRAKKD